MEFSLFHMEMSTANYANVLHGITAVTLLIQSYILYLIMLVSPKEMHSYRYFLGTFCFWDLMFTLIFGGMLVPFGGPNNSEYGVYGSVLYGFAKYISPHWQIIMVGLGFYSGSLLIMSQNYCLLYRLAAIIDNHKIYRWFLQWRTKAVFICFQQFTAILLGWLAYMSFIQEKDFQASVNEIPNKDLRRFVASYGFFVWVNTRSKYLVWFFSMFLVGFLCMEIIGVTLVVCIAKVLRQNVQYFSKHTYVLHRKLLLLLIFQFSLPILFIAIPTVFQILNYKIFQMEYGDWFIEWTCILISMYAIFNAILTITFVDAYRKHLFKQLKYIKQKFMSIFYPTHQRQRLQSISAVGCKESTF